MSFNLSIRGPLSSRCSLLALSGRFCIPSSRTGLRYSSTETLAPIMSTIRNNLKGAMRSGNAIEKTVLRAILSEVKNQSIANPGSVSSDIKFRSVVEKMIAERKKSIKEIEKASRLDLIEKEKEELQVLEQCAQLVAVASDEEIDGRVKEILSSLGTDKPELKQVMSKIPWKQVESSWNSSRGSVTASVQRLLGKKSFSTWSSSSSHENPLGIPRGPKPPKPSMKGIPRRLPDISLTRKSVPGVAKIVAVSSAKGGVGKSTIAANLALALFGQGLNVGILDVDIFGPSIPRLLNLKGEPLLSEENLLIPLENYGIQAMSMGFLVDPDKAIAWRGLLVQKALQQLLFEVQWNRLDVLVLDMPPGTGDVQLTIAQQVKVDGALVVSTPQDIALIDAVRGIDMFSKIQVPVLGIVQNMSAFICPNCNHESHIFGWDGALKEAEKRGLDVLANVPLHPDICSSSDDGKPLVISHPDSTIATVYNEMASKVWRKLSSE